MSEWSRRPLRSRLTDVVTIKADGDRWKVRLGQDRPRPGIRVVLFFCATTDQRPYRVVEVPEDRFDTQDDVERLQSELTSLIHKLYPETEGERVRFDVSARKIFFW